MSRVARIAGRELRAQAPLAVVAVVAALLPWLAPVLPGVGGSSAAEVRHAGAALVAGLLALAVGAAAGAGLVGRELAEGRLPFYLALPLRPWELWLGKLLAACALVYGAVALALAGLGSAAVEGLREVVLSLQVDSVAREEVAVVALLAILATAPLLVILLTHHLTVAMRSRSPWLLVDLGTVGVAGVLGGWSLERLRNSLAFTELAWAAVAACIALVLAFGIGGWAGLARGGVLPARLHRTQALAVAAGLLAAAGGLAAWAAWTVRPGIGAVRAVHQLTAAPSGGWALSLARVAGRPSFSPWILSGPGGAIRLSPGLPGFEMRPPADFSADGRALVWRRPLKGALDLEHELVWITLDGGAPRLEPTGIVVRGGPRVALTSGGLLAVRDRGELRLWAARGRQALAAAPVEDTGGTGADEVLDFVGDTARLTSLVREGSRAFLRVATLSAGEHRLAVGGREPLDPAGGSEVFVESFEVSPDGTRLAVIQGFAGSGGVTLHDAASGALIGRAGGPDGAALRNARFLADGSLALPVRRGDEILVRVVSPGGARLGEQSLGRGLTGAEIAGEWRPGKLLVSVAVAWRVYEAHRELRELDLKTGRWRSLHEHLRPAAGPSVRPGDRAVRLFHHQRDRCLVEVDVERGTLRQLLPVPAGGGTG